MAKIKQQLRTFRVREPFNDPYISKQYQPGDDVQEEDLVKNGWKPSDIQRAVGNLLIPHLLPKPTEPVAKTDSGESEE